MKVFEFILILVAMVFLFQLVRHKMGFRGSRLGHGLPDARAGGDQLETEKLRDEVRQLKERIQVLERITVEKENSLSREIEDLRNR